MDFLADNLFDGRKLGALIVVDQYCRECLAIHVGQRLIGEDVIQVMQNVAFKRAHPKFIKPITARSLFPKHEINGLMRTK
jgi:hypothetical protein